MTAKDRKMMQRTIAELESECRTAEAILANPRSSDRQKTLAQAALCRAKRDLEIVRVQMEVL